MKLQEELETLKLHAQDYAAPRDLCEAVKAVTNYFDEASRLATIKRELEDAKSLLVRANKWVSMIEDRREDAPQWFRHDADPEPLRKEIDAFLR